MGGNKIHIIHYIERRTAGRDFVPKTIFCHMDDLSDIYLFHLHHTHNNGVHLSKLYKQ